MDPESFSKQPVPGPGPRDSAGNSPGSSLLSWVLGLGPLEGVLGPGCRIRSSPGSRGFLGRGSWFLVLPGPRSFSRGNMSWVLGRGPPVGLACPGSVRLPRGPMRTACRRPVFRGRPRARAPPRLRWIGAPAVPRWHPGPLPCPLGSAAGGRFPAASRAVVTRPRCGPEGQARWGGGPRGEQTGGLAGARAGGAAAIAAPAASPRDAASWAGGRGESAGRPRGGSPMEAKGGRGSAAVTGAGRVGGPRGIRAEAAGGKSGGRREGRSTRGRFRETGLAGRGGAGKPRVGLGHREALAASHALPPRVFCGPPVAPSSGGPVAGGRPRARGLSRPPALWMPAVAPRPRGLLCLCFAKPPGPFPLQPSAPSGRAYCGIEQLPRAARRARARV